MRVAVVATGSELARGRRREGNAAWLARLLDEAGHDLVGWSVLPDETAAIADGLAAAARRAELVVVTGGLGPTVDDVTRDAAAALAGVDLVFDPAAWNRITGKFAARGYGQPPENNRRQALFPAGAAVIENSFGTADAFQVDAAGARFVFLPGVPAEFRYLAGPLVAGLPAPDKTRILVYTFYKVGEGTLDTAINEHVVPLLASPDDYGICVEQAFYRVTLRVADATAARRVRRAMRGVYRKNQLSTRGREPWEAVLAILARRGHTLAFAESCTGGLLGARCTAVPGASRVFRGSIVAYANAVKTALLGVPADLLAKQGAVSNPCALLMAIGVRKALGTDIGIAVTGVAGPGGGTDKKPVGTVFLAIDAPRLGNFSTERHFNGDREAVRELAASAALGLLVEEVGRWNG